MKIIKNNKNKFNGAYSQNRTGDLQVTNLLLYQLSYVGIIIQFQRQKVCCLYTLLFVFDL